MVLCIDHQAAIEHPDQRSRRQMTRVVFRSFFRVGGNHGNRLDEQTQKVWVSIRIDRHWCEDRGAELGRSGGGFVRFGVKNCKFLLV